MPKIGRMEQGMRKIKDAFRPDRKALIAFLTGGDPNLETTERLIPIMAAAGADIIEIGIPFSDPIAEGPVIQAADERALSAGTTPDKLFDMVSRVRDKVDVPLLFMTYLNPVYKYGIEAFTKRCAEVGIGGIILPDMPFEEANEYLSKRSDSSIELVSLVTPTSKNRAVHIATQAEGFLYCVSSLGVTGVRSEIGTEIGDVIQEVKAHTDIPCAVGFGVSTPEQAKAMAEISDGVIVGSAIVRIIAEHGTNADEPVAAYIRSLRAALD
jgi:tryptophan synthase alpha chain